MIITPDFNFNINIKKTIRYTIISICFFFQLISANSQTNKIYDFSYNSTGNRLYKDISILASDSFMGREAGTTGEKYAKEYIASCFKEAGLLPAGDNGTFFQSFSILNSENGQTANDTVYNVIGFINNHKPKTVIIGAHYDHLGKSNWGSRDKSENLIHNGADDNASGTATVIELARKLSGAGNMNSNFIFIAFSAEERGLLGSYHFVRSNLFNASQIKYYMNFDMTGRLGIIGNRVIVLGTGTSSAWNQVIRETKTKEIKFKKLKAAPGFSDHQPFYENGIPYIYYTTGLHPDYHTSKDDTEFINIKGCIKIAAIAYDFIKAADKKENIYFQKCTKMQLIKSTIFFTKML